MRNNLNQLINKQLVDQFQNVVKAEIRKHNNAIEKTDEALDTLKKTFSKFYEENKNTKSTTEALYGQILKDFKDFTDEISYSFKDQRIFIKENDKKLNKIIEEFEETINNLVNCEYFEEYRIDMLHDLNSQKKQFEDSKEELREEIYDSYKKNRDYIHSTSKESDERSDDIEGILVSLKKDLEEYKTDAVGILRENEVVKKTMFIMEKKIENIYTLIERLNKKGS